MRPSVDKSLSLFMWGALAGALMTAVPVGGIHLGSPASLHVLLNAQRTL